MYHGTIRIPLPDTFFDAVGEAPQPDLRPVDRVVTVRHRVHDRLEDRRANDLPCRVAHAKHQVAAAHPLQQRRGLIGHGDPSPSLRRPSSLRSAGIGSSPKCSCQHFFIHFSAKCIGKCVISHFGQK